MKPTAQGTSNRLSMLKPPSSLKQKHLTQQQVRAPALTPSSQPKDKPAFVIGQNPPPPTRPSMPLAAPTSKPLVASPYQSVQMFIHRIIGMTSNCGDNLAMLSEKVCAYLCQSTIVVYDLERDFQLLHFQNANNKPYRVLKFFEGQNWLVAGEGGTKLGEVHVFNVDFVGKDEIKLQQIFTLRGHKYGVRAVALVNQILISIGDDNDRGMLVWNLAFSNFQIVAANLSKSHVITCLVPLAPTSAFEVRFVTAGTSGHLKLWKVGWEKAGDQRVFKVDGEEESKGVSKLKGTKLEKLESLDFVSIVAAGEDLVLLAADAKGQSPSKSSKWCLVKYSLSQNKVTAKIELKEKVEGYSIAKVGEKEVLVGGAYGSVKVLDVEEFQLGADENWLKAPASSKFQKITSEVYEYLQNQQAGDNEYSNIIGLSTGFGVVVQLRDDGMLLAHNKSSQSLIRVLLSHCDAINDLAIKEYTEAHLSLYTGSKDRSLRLWSVGLEGQQAVKGDPVEGSLKRILFMEEEQDSGIRKLAFNPVKNQLAVGDEGGNIRIYELSAHDPNQLRQVQYIQAHEGKITSLSYSEPFLLFESEQYVQFLVSASTDHMIHIFSATSDEHELIQTIDAHSTSVTAAAFTATVVASQPKKGRAGGPLEKQLRLYSCSADRIILGHRFSQGQFVLLPGKELSRHKVNALVLSSQQIVLAKDQGVLEVKSIDGGKQLAMLQNQPMAGTVSKQMMDYLACAISDDHQLLALCDKDKNLYIREVRQPSNLLSKITLTDNFSSLKFTSDNKYLICTSMNPKETGGGMIYVVRVEHSPEQAKLSQRKVGEMRNSNGVVIIDQLEQERRPFKMGSNLSQEEPDAKMRSYKVREDLFNTWARSTTTDQPKAQEAPEKKVQSIDDIVVGGAGRQRASTYTNKGNGMEAAAKQPGNQPVVDAFLGDLIQENEEFEEEEEENLLEEEKEEEVKRVLDFELAKKENEHMPVVEVEEVISPSQRRVRNSITMIYMRESTLKKHRQEAEEHSDNDSPLHTDDSNSNKSNSPKEDSPKLPEPKVLQLSTSKDAIEQLQSATSHLQEILKSTSLNQEERISLALSLSSTISDLASLQRQLLSP